ncbi:MAG TPA: hypothetical protein VM008_10825 [Phycisphaerae bacterium]|nr:hypothetical protein [Phycisphaerae bacterium]
MAVVRARSAPPYLALLFVGLWIVSTVLAILFYISGGRTSDDLKKAQDDLKNIASQQERMTVLPELLKGSTGKTALGVAAAQIESLKNAIGAGPEASVADIAAPGNGLIAQALTRAGLPANGKLLDGFNALAAKYRAETERSKTLAANYDALKTQVDTDKRNYDAAAQSLQQSVDALKGQLGSATGATGAADQARQQAIADYEKKLSDMRDAQEAERRNTVLQTEQIKDQLAQANERIRLLQDEIEKYRPTSNTNVGREPAGLIVRAATGSGEVYINLGRRDHVTPGLTFAVYDPQTGVRFDSDEAAAGKGSIEVLAIGDSESLCRVTQTTKGQAIQSGDLISNPVYQHDKNRQFHFVVIGDFDLDGDGVATPAERDRLIRMVKSWGGVIDDKVTTQTDFLVAGARPASPIVSSDDQATPGSVADERIKKQQAYDDTIAEAKRSTVPILNANRFLAMIGYYNTTVVRG